MSSGINRLHGRTFLQKYLCREYFHNNYENSVFNVKYNYDCNYNMWGGVSCGMGFAFGAGFMDMIMNWINTKWLGNFTPTYPSFNFASGFAPAGGFTPAGGASKTQVPDAGNSSAGAAPKPEKAPKAPKTPKTKVKERKTNLDEANIKEITDKVRQLLNINSKNYRGNLQEDFNKIYYDVTTYERLDHKNTRTDKNILKQRKKELEEFAKDNELSVPNADQIKAEKNRRAEEAKVETPEEKPVVIRIPGADENANQENTLESRINQLDTNDIDKIIELIGEAKYNQDQEALNTLNEMFGNYLKSIKTDSEKLNQLKDKVQAYPDLEQKVDVAINALEQNKADKEENNYDELSEQTTNMNQYLQNLANSGGYDELPGDQIGEWDNKFYDLLYKIADKLPPEKAKKELESLLGNQNLPERFISNVFAEIYNINQTPAEKETRRKDGVQPPENPQLTAIEPDGTNEEGFTKILDFSNLDMNATQSLIDNENVFAFARNENMSDKWIKGRMCDYTKGADGKIESYIIDCKDVGSFGLKFKVTKKSDSDNTFIIAYVPDSNINGRTLYTPKDGLEYTLADDGVLVRTDNEPLVSLAPREGYTSLEEIDSQ